MNEIDRIKFNRLENQGERLKTKLEKLIQKQIKIFQKMGACYKEVLILHQKQFEIVEQSQAKNGKLLCGCGEIIENLEFKRCEKCRKNSNKYSHQYRILHPQKYETYAKGQYEKSKAAAQ